MMTRIKQIKKLSLMRTMPKAQDKNVNLLGFVIRKIKLKWICQAAPFTTAITVEGKNTKNSSRKFSKMIQRITTPNILDMELLNLVVVT